MTKPGEPLPKAVPNRSGPTGCAAAASCAACDVRSLTFCAGLAPQEIGRISAIVTRQRIPAHQMLFYEGDPAEHAYNVTRGAVKLYKLLPDGRRQITGFLLAGDFLGLAGRDGYSYSAETITDVELCRFSRRKLDELFNQFPQLERRMLKLATDELIAAQDQMLLLGRRTAAEKVASFLLRLCERERVRGQPGNPVLLPMTRGDIADYLGLTIETVSRTLSQFKRDNLVRQLSLNELELVDEERLQAFVEG
ncbi:MAG: cyclic nucleotide-binding domain-containing protein [Alphaproteobacteria bacterium]